MPGPPEEWSRGQTVSPVRCIRLKIDRDRQGLA